MDVTKMIQPRDDMPDVAGQTMGVVAGGRAAVQGMPDQQKPAVSEKTKVSDEDAQTIAENMNQVASAFNARLSFSVDKDTGKTVIKVEDKDTHEVIRQIPPEETLRLIRKMKNVMGMLFDIES
jgi:flagellar protein FlaG